MSGEQVLQRRTVAQGGLHQLAAQHRIAIAAGQIVEGNHLLAAIEQHLDHVCEPI